MKTTTATKTAVTWMIVGGVAALAASMALGLPWKNLENGITSKRAVYDTGKVVCTTGSIDCSGKDTNGALADLKCGKIDSNGQYNTCKADVVRVGEVWCSCTGPKVNAITDNKNGGVISSKRYAIDCYDENGNIKKGKFVDLSLLRNDLWKYADSYCKGLSASVNEWGAKKSGKMGWNAIDR